MKKKLFENYFLEIFLFYFVMCDSAEKTKSGLLRKHFVSAKKGSFFSVSAEGGSFCSRTKSDKSRSGENFFHDFVNIKIF